MKKIYVLIKNKEAMFFFEWFEQCKDIVQKYKNVKSQNFAYKEDNEKSLIKALQEGRTYAKEAGAMDIPSLEELVENYILYYNLEDLKDEEQKVSLEKLKTLHEEDYEVEDNGFWNQNSLRVDQLVNIACGQRTFVNRSIYTGYDPIVFYYLLLELYMEPKQTVFCIDAYKNDLTIKQAFEQQDSDKINKDLVFLRSDDEYKELRYEMNALEFMTNKDFVEVTNRVSRLVFDTYDGPLREPLAETRIFKNWLFKERRTLADMYRELVTNPVYRKRIEAVGGTWKNPDLSKREIKKEKNPGLATLVEGSTELRKALMEKVVGQDAVIDQFEKAYFNAEKKHATADRKKGPKHVFLFAGSPGVGKTFLAETFAETIGLPYKRFDMAAYAGREALEGLVGFERTYRNSAPGVLTDFVDANPKCVILFDEIEKANEQVILNFLQILDSGFCVDKKKEKQVSFQDAILIFTTNAGKQLYEGAQNTDLSSLPTKKILDALNNDINPKTKLPYFPGAIASRMSSYTVLMFNHLNAADIIKVVEKDVANTVRMNSQKFGIRMTGYEKIAPTLMFSIGGRADARNASKKASQFMDKELYSFLTRTECLKDDKLKGIKWSFDVEHAAKGVKEIYQGVKDGVVALFTDLKIEKSLILDNNQIKVVSTCKKDEFIRMIENENVIYAVIDYTFGSKTGKDLGVLNCKSAGRELFEFVKKENAELDIFLIEKENKHFTELEKKELRLRNVSGFISLTEKRISSDVLEETYKTVSYEKAMKNMFFRHQVLSFDTEHSLDKDTGIGEIKLCNLRLETVIDASDENEFIGADVMPNVHWDDIRVSEKLKEELKFFVDYLKNPKDYQKKGLRTPKGVLLYGPPGTGKTSLAKVVATESGINFIAVGADELRNGGPAKVESLFRTAREYAPTVLFIDEIDAIGLDRTMTGMNSSLNRLLVEMDGFKKNDNKPVFVMAATNLGDDIDPALARRFDQKVEVPLPDKEDRKWLFQFFINKHKDAFSEVTEAQIDSLVVRSKNLSPSSIENVIEASYRESIRRNVKVNDAILDDMFEQTLFGDERKDVKATDLKQTAIHEAGHVICDYIAAGNIPSYMTVIGRGDFAGYMVPGENEKKHLSKQDYLNKICTALGGRAAELVFYGDEGLSPGISQDIRTATYYAQNMVCNWAMYGDEIGLSVIPVEQIHYYPKATDLVNRILAEQMEKALNIVKEQKAMVEKLVEEIMNSAGKNLTQKEIENILKKGEV